MTDNFDSQLQISHTEATGRLYRSPFSTLRPSVVLPFQISAALLLVASLAALAYRWARCAVHPPDVLLWIGTVIYGFILMRMAALAYVAVYLGPFESRVMYSSHVLALLLAPMLIAEAWRARRPAHRGLGSNENR